MKSTGMYLGFVVFFGILLSCGQPSSEAITGTWEDMQGLQIVEFRADGTTRWMDQDTLTGTYNFTQQGSLTVRWNVSGSSALQPSRFDVTVRGETLTLKATNGAVLRYQKMDQEE